MTREIVYLGRDNSVDLLLKEDGVAYNLSGFTAMTLLVGTVEIESSNGSTASIRWAKDGYDTGEVRLYIGNVANLVAGKFCCPLVVYDAATYTNGLVWGYVDLTLRDDFLD